MLPNRQLGGHKFRRQHQYGNYIVDFYCHEADLVVECDGPIHEENEQWQHDQERSIYLISQGLRILRFANDDILNHPEQVLATIGGKLPPINHEG